jgi:predicted metalloprotease
MGDVRSVIGPMLLLAAVAGSAALGACASDEPAGVAAESSTSAAAGSEAGSSATQAGSETTVPADTHTDTHADTGTDDPEETFDEEVRAVAGLLERFWSDAFAASGIRYPALGGFGSYTAGDGTTCAGRTIPSENALYCPAGDFVAYDDAWLRHLYEDIGDGAVYVVMPHEWGHAAQARLGSTFSLGVERELQADCYAGAFVAWVLDAGAVVEEEGDAEEMFTNLAEVADPTDEWWRPEAHGSVERRQAAFTAGVDGGIAAC